MKRFFTHTLLFISPFVFYIAIVIIVDPFEFFTGSHVFTHESKEMISGKINYPLWKLMQFRKNPCDNIILGDSRAARLDVHIIEKITGNKYCNLSYGGATLNEVIETFWEVVKKIDLKNIYIGINLDNYNGNNLRDRVSGTREILNNPVLYIANRDVLTATYYLLKSVLFHKKTDIEKPPMDRNEFWKYQLNVTTDRFYAAYKYPEGMKLKLKQLADYCKKNEIRLFFIIMPTHVSLQEKVHAYHLDKYQTMFLDDIKMLGSVYDFDYPNRLTQSRDNFEDPYHPQYDVTLEIINEVWSGSKGVARIYN